MTDFIFHIVAIIIIMNVLVTVHMSSIVFIGRCFELIIEKMSLGMGPLLFKRGILHVHMLPFGGYVKFPGRDPLLAEVNKSSEASERTGQTALLYEDLGMFKQILVIGSTLVLMLVIADQLLAENIYEMYFGVIESLAQVFWSPLSDGQIIINETVLLLMECSYFELLGYVMAYYAIFNMLPFPLVAGGEILFIVFRVRDISIVLVEILNWIGLIVLVTWSVALVRYFLF